MSLDAQTARTFSYGEWERDPTVAPAIGPSHGFEGRFLGMRLYRVLRRRVYETWRNEAGEKMGRWTWERSEPV